MPALQTVFGVLIRFETELRNAADTRLPADCDLPLSRFAVTQVIARLMQHRGCSGSDNPAYLLRSKYGSTRKRSSATAVQGCCWRNGRNTLRRVLASSSGSAAPGK